LQQLSNNLYLNLNPATLADLFKIWLKQK